MEADFRLMGYNEQVILVLWQQVYINISSLRISILRSMAIYDIMRIAIFIQKTKSLQLFDIL